jgi:hypothetical protein
MGLKTKEPLHIYNIKKIKTPQEHDNIAVFREFLF